LSTLARETGATDSWHFETGHAILLAALVLAALTAVLPPALMRPPAWMVLPFADWINWLFVFLKDDLGFIHVTRAISSLVEWLLDISANILYGKNRWPRFDQLPWSVIAITAFFIGYGLKGWRLGLLSGGTFVWIALLGQWKWAMETLSVILIATPFAVFLGLALGVAAWRYPRFERALNPILNIAQSLPHFAYMIPVVIFVGVGPKAGAIVTIIFATPPMIRMTILGLKMVAPEVVESGKMCGATAWQLLRHVRTPTARTEILVGVNQVIMQCLAMVVLASFIGMPGLGQKLLQLLQSLKIGRSIEIGITIVLIAVTLDRCSKAWAEKQPVHHERGTPWWQQYRIALLWAALTAAAFALSAVWPLAYEIKRTQAFTLSKEFDAIVDGVIIFIDPIFAASSFSGS
jgi:glycine betaine/proline transport system permease protein